METKLKPFCLRPPSCALVSVCMLNVQPINGRWLNWPNVAVVKQWGFGSPPKLAALCPWTILFILDPSYVINMTKLNEALRCYLSFSQRRRHGILISRKMLPLWSTTYIQVPQLTTVRLLTIWSYDGTKGDLRPFFLHNRCSIPIVLWSKWVTNSDDGATSAWAG